MAIPLEQFRRQLSASTLLPDEELDSLLAELPPEERPADSEQLAKLLVKKKLLTPFQTRQIYYGKGKSLLLGNYLVLDKLGQGGMGLVYKAQHRRMERIVALKVLSPGVTRSATALSRFHREVKAAARLVHPNIVTAYDADEADGTHYLVMQYVAGEDLSALVHRNGRLPLRLALEYLIQTARGLQYAHEQGIVHRDIKPSNLLLDVDGTIKILDMGLARIDAAADQQQDQLTGTGQIMGTVDYMAPEQAVDSRHADARADIYSLGATLWMLLTARPMYEADTVVKRLMAHQQREIPSLLTFREDVSAELNATFQKMVAKDPDQRQESMSEVIAALQNCLEPGGEQPSVRKLAADQPDRSDNQLLAFLHGFSKVSSGDKPEIASVAAPPEAAFPETINQARDDLASRETTHPNLQGLLIGTAAIKSKADTRVVAPAMQSRGKWMRIGLAAVATCGLSAAIFLLTKQQPLSETPTPQASELTSKNDNAGNDSSQKKPAVKTDRAAAWREWPQGAPEPAIAPFDKARAVALQAAWADYLHVPARFTNASGMAFVLIPPGEFNMGSSAEESAAALKRVPSRGDPNSIAHQKRVIQSESPPRRVAITQPFYMAVHETSQKDYQACLGNNPSYFGSEGKGAPAVKDSKPELHPVEGETWHNAIEFCNALSMQDGLATLTAGEISPQSPEWNSLGYRLPTEAEWEFACRAGTITRFWCGEFDRDLQGYAFSAANSMQTTQPVGITKANPFGLFDMHGNVWEWTLDGYRQTPEINASGISVNPHVQQSASGRIVRGGSWVDYPTDLRSARREAIGEAAVLYHLGFRTVLSIEAARKVLTGKRSNSKALWHGWPEDAPPPTIAPLTPTQASECQSAWSNYLGLPAYLQIECGIMLRLIPPGEFFMGARQEDLAEAIDGADSDTAKAAVQAASPRHQVIVTKPFYLGECEVTQGQYTKVVGSNPAEISPRKATDSDMNPLQLPVENVDWRQICEFCDRLSDQEKLPRFDHESVAANENDASGFRLPTEAQWEYACRAGTNTRYARGDLINDLSLSGHYLETSAGHPHVVAELAANPFFLYDMHGNVAEFVRDWWSTDYYRQNAPAINPLGPATGTLRIIRGGNWNASASDCRSFSRRPVDPNFKDGKTGFRVAISMDAVRKIITRRATNP